MPKEPNNNLGALDLDVLQLDLDVIAVALAGENNGRGHGSGNGGGQGGGQGGGRYKLAPVLDDQTFEFDEGISEIAITPATDDDKKDVVSYAFDDGTADGSSTVYAHGQQFEIDSTSGLITSTTPLNFETSKSYSLAVLATDLGGNTDTATVTVNLRDVDEFDITTPTDIDTNSNQVYENDANGTAVRITAKADDNDGTDFVSSYVLVNSETDHTVNTTGPFEIDPSTGIVTIRNSSLIDHETDPTPTIYVKATSSDGSTAVEAFDIQVLNVNEDPLGAVSISTQTTTQTTDITRPLSASDITNSATQVYNPDNGHVYEFVNTVVSWEDAYTLSAASSLSGVDGYLGNITSEVENSFVHQAALSRITEGYYGSMWLGASDAELEGSWYWVTGPEAGTQFWQGAGPNGIHGPAGIPVDGQYSNWRGGVYDAPNTDNGEPGDDNADYVLMLVQNGGGEPLGTWEDGANSYEYVSSNLPGGNAYVIEYSGDVTETISETAWLLTADTSSISDPDGNGTYQFQWQQSSTGTDDWTDIFDATEDTYQATSDDAGTYFRVQISYTDGGGFNESLVSDPVQPVEQEPPPGDPPPEGLLEFDGHYYLIAEDQNITRSDAETAASQSSFELDGVTYEGHLATITSSLEENLIENAIYASNGDSYFDQEPASFWLGGEYVNDQWTWTSGAEDGQAFSYTDWWGGVPGGPEEVQGSSEPFLVLNMYERSDINGVWYSYDAGDTSLIRGYVTEFRPDLDV